MMERHEVEALRARVGCAVLLDREGFAIDRKESTKRAVKFRRGDEIVIHEGCGWFDARSEAKGDVFALATHLTGSGFAASLDLVGSLSGGTVSRGSWTPSARDNDPMTMKSDGDIVVHPDAVRAFAPLPVANCAT